MPHAASRLPVAVPFLQMLSSLSSSGSAGFYRRLSSLVVFLCDCPIFMPFFSSLFVLFLHLFFVSYFGGGGVLLPKYNS